MAQTIKIKRSTSAAQPSSALSAGELAYSFNSSKLFIGDGSNNDIIGGELFTNMLDHTAGTLTASSAIIVDSSSKIDKLLVDNIRIGNTINQIDTDSGSLTIAPASNLIITHGGTIDLSGQANEVTILDNNSAAFEIKEGSTSYFKLVTTNSSEKIFLGKDTVIDGNGSTGGITISDGLIDMRTGTGSVSKIKFYCESSNAHFQTLQAAPHSASASNTLVLPSAGSNLISDTATQTLTNKTLTSPDINTPDIDGGAIDGAVIGANTRAAASYTTVNANSTVTGQSFTDGTATWDKVGTQPTATATISGEFIIGYNFDMQVQLPTLYRTFPSGTSYRSDTRSDLIIHRIKFSFGDVGVYSINLKRSGKPDYTEVKEVNKANTVESNSLTFVSDKIETVPCYERNEHLTVQISSKHPSPATIVSYSWEGDYNKKSYSRV